MIMKTHFFYVLFTFLLLCKTSFAQVGMGTAQPNLSAQLEVVASHKGMLIPRLVLKSLTDTTTITNGNVESLLVYNKKSSKDIAKGFYYWNVVKWERIVNESLVEILVAKFTMKAFNNKVDKESGKSLSTNDFTNELKSQVNLNSTKNGITLSHENAIIKNTSKTGITTAQIANISSNKAAAQRGATLKKDFDKLVKDRTEHELQLQATLLNKLNKTDIVKTLTSTSDTMVLSANKGRELKALVDQNKNDLGKKISTTAIVNNLIDGGEQVPLSAEQGRLLMTFIRDFAVNDNKKVQELTTKLSEKLNKTDIVNNLTSASPTKALSANQGKVLKALVDDKSLSMKEISVHYTATQTDEMIFVEGNSNKGITIRLPKPGAGKRLFIKKINKLGDYVTLLAPFGFLVEGKTAISNTAQDKFGWVLIANGKSWYVAASVLF